MLKAFELLNFEQICYFFTNNDIPLQHIEPLTKEEGDALLKAADMMGTLFGSFVLYAVFNEEHNGIQTNFESYMELYSCYLDFMMGCEPLISNNDLKSTN